MSGREFFKVFCKPQVNTLLLRYLHFLFFLPFSSPLNARLPILIFLFLLKCVYSVDPLLFPKVDSWPFFFPLMTDVWNSGESSRSAAAAP